MPKIGVIGTPGVANPTVRPCGNLASIVMTRTLIVPTAKMRKRMKRLKMTSSAITMRISNTTEKEFNYYIFKYILMYCLPIEIKDEKNKFKTILGFLLEIGTPFSSI